MKLHVLAIPHTVTSKEYLSCAFTQKVLKFCQMMKPHYEIIHYGHQRSEVDCHEHVTVMTDEVLLKTYGSYNWKKDFFRHSIDDLAHKTFNINAHYELTKRVVPGDAILCFWGKGVEKSVEGLDNHCFIIEPGIGYAARDTFAPFKVFESYSHMHVIYGALGVTKGNRYDAVIPNYFDLADFEYNEEKSDYFLFLSRVTHTKGLETAIEVTRKSGDKLIIAGQGDIKNLGYTRTPKHVEYAGFADVEKRKKLLRDAKALFLPTLYIEPFGGVTIEAMLSGTPVITTDWGAFTENNIHGVTGFRCRNEEEFLWATKNINKISSKACRDWAENNFSMERVAKLYCNYFMSLKNNFVSQEQTGDTIQFDNDVIDGFNWLNRFYPTEKPFTGKV